MKAETCILCILLLLLGNTTISQESSQNRKYDFPRRNSIYLQNLVVFPVLYYDRIIPISDKFGVIPKLGFMSGLGYGNSLLFESSIFLGGNKHYGEIGVVWWSEAMPVIINYRYMGRKGLLLKVGYQFPGVYKNLIVVGFGYSF
jgi:hypothetical protein